MIVLKANYKKAAKFKIKGDSLEVIIDKLNTYQELNIKEATTEAIEAALKNNGFDNIIWIF